MSTAFENLVKNSEICSEAVALVSAGLFSVRCNNSNNLLHPVFCNSLFFDVKEDERGKTMQWFILIVSALGVFGLIYYLNQKEKTRLLSENKIIDRGNYNYYKQAHFFSTRISSIEEIGNALDKQVISVERISFEPNYDKGMIVFRQGGGGTFAAALRSYEKEAELYKYRFQVEAWRERKGGITRLDMFGANVLLTAIERTFFQLDNNTNVQRQAAKYKTKPNFF